MNFSLSCNFWIFQQNLKDKTLRPYIIGLTGGIASGKSSIAEKLEKLGAGHVNCDKIAHDLYEPGKECYKLIVENFGTDILNSERFIDRKALGNIVFNNKVKIYEVIHFLIEKKLTKLTIIKI